MATYIHAKMTTNANKGHRRFGTSRTTKSSRNGGKGHVRQIDSLRTRWRQAVTGSGITGFTTAERLFKANLTFGGSKGTTYTGTTIGRTNTSVGDKDLIRDSAA